MAIDGKLFRIFAEACANPYASRADLAREIAGRKFEEFSYQRNNEKHYITWGGVMEYVGLLVQFGMLDEELKPYVVPAKITRSGFDFSLGEKVEAFASNAGFSVDRVKDAVRQLLARNPAQLPVPLTVHAVLQIECRYGVFYRAMAVKAFQERVGVFIKTKQTFIITDVFRD